MAALLPTAKLKSYQATCMVERTPFRYQFVANSRASATLVAKELMPSSEIISILEEGEW